MGQLELGGAGPLPAERGRRRGSLRVLAHTGAFDAELLSSAALVDATGLPVPTRARARPRRASSVRRSLMLADVIGVAVALLLTQFAIVTAVEPHELAIDALLVPALIGWVGLAHGYGLYDRMEIGVARSLVDDLPGIAVLATVATWLGLLVIEMTGLAHPRIGVAAAFWLTSIGFVTIGRAAARAIVQRRSLREPTLVIGSGRVATWVAQKLIARPSYGLDVIGFLDDDPHELDRSETPYLGTTADLEQVIRAHRVERIIVAFSQRSAEGQVDLLRRCADLNVRVEIVPRMYEIIGSRSHVHDIDGVPLISLKAARLTRPSRWAKRALDVTVAGSILVVLAPFFLFCALMIRREGPGPVFFRQERMGAGGTRFRILKFRSMYHDADARKDEIAHLNRHTGTDPRMFKIEEDPRITRFGRFLRRWSLDELPQLINVLRGQMSLVGPRPLILDEDEHILGAHRRRLQLTPGITGLWQVLGRSDIPFGEMVALDYLYVTNWSLWGDVKLLARTVPAILSRRGAY